MSFAIKVFSYIENNYFKELTITIISKAVNTSYSHTHKIIHFLEDKGYITLTKTGVKQIITRTDKLFDILDFTGVLYK